MRRIKKKKGGPVRQLSKPTTVNDLSPMARTHMVEGEQVVHINKINKIKI